MLAAAGMKGVFDSNEIFNEDTLRGGAKKPEIVKVQAFFNFHDKSHAIWRLLQRKVSSPFFCKLKLIVSINPRGEGNENHDDHFEIPIILFRSIP